MGDTIFENGGVWSCRSGTIIMQTCCGWIPSIQLMAPVINLACVEALAMSPLVCQQMLRRTWQMRQSSFLTSNMDTSAALCRCNPSKFEFVVCNAISCVQMFCVLRSSFLVGSLHMPQPFLR